MSVKLVVLGVDLGVTVFFSTQLHLCLQLLFSAKPVIVWWSFCTLPAFSFTTGAGGRHPPTICLSVYLRERITKCPLCFELLGVFSIISALVG